MTRTLTISLLALAACAALPPVALARQETAAVSTIALQLREQVTVTGDVRLRDVVERGEALPETVQSRVVTFHSGRGEATLSLFELEIVLLEAGYRADQITLGGASSCHIIFNKPTQTQRDALDGWAEESGEAIDWAVTAQAELHSDVDAQLQRAELPTVALHDQIVAAVTEKLELPVGSVELELTSRDAQLIAAPGVVLHDVTANDLDRLSFTIETGGQTRTIRARATAMVETIQLVRPVARGVAMHPRDLAIDTTRISQMSDRTASAQDVVGQIAKRGLDVGTPLLAKHIEAPLDVRRGQTIVVSLSRGGVALRVLATATKDARAGESITVRNDATGQSLRVLVTGPQTASAQ